MTDVPTELQGQLLRLLAGLKTGETPYTAAKIEGEIGTWVTCEPIDQILFAALTEGSSRGPSARAARLIEQAGYLMYAGERDSFGWLIGVIFVPGIGKISFG